MVLMLLNQRKLLDKKYSDVFQSAKGKMIKNEGMKMSILKEKVILSLRPPIQN